nr:Chain C, Auxin-responsive protein IAA7 [synthetic construct]2P1N_F Chain F, Auxin-responsive protein IAA7 [synthetic construct]2P1O_C Chain C, Auxin-responsive protein IAA7 [synthetic construct]2P1Q_C Chain C, Auxin-responsive protein IAA7 [synthetic construct]
QVVGWPPVRNYRK